MFRARNILYIRVCNMYVCVRTFCAAIIMAISSCGTFAMTETSTALTVSCLSENSKAALTPDICAAFVDAVAEVTTRDVQVALQGVDQDITLVVTSSGRSRLMARIDHGDTTGVVRATIRKGAPLDRPGFKVFFDALIRETPGLAAVLR